MDCQIDQILFSFAQKNHAERMYTDGLVSEMTQNSPCGHGPTPIWEFSARLGVRILALTGKVLSKAITGIYIRLNTAETLRVRKAQPLREAWM
jgi:hypothetical protein